MSTAGSVPRFNCKKRSWMLEKSQVEGGEHQDYADICDKPFQDAASKERDI